MALNGPTTEDQRKIHAEINQILNQRLLLTMLAVTVFGAIAAWLIPKDPPIVGSSVGLFRYSVSILLLVVLLVLFFLLLQLKQMLWVLASYLVVTKASGWERDFIEFARGSRRFGYTRSQGTVFLLLGLLAGALPFLLWFTYSLELAPVSGAVVTFAATVIYEILVIRMAFYGWLEQDAFKRWQEVRDRPTDNG